MRHHIQGLLQSSLLAGLLLWQGASSAQTIDLDSLKPFCRPPFKASADLKSCQADPAQIAKLDTATKCSGVGLTFASGTCSAVADRAPKPVCGEAIPDLVAKDGKCVIERRVPRSALADYVGDCFRITAVPKDDNIIGHPSDTVLKVLSQKPVGADDKELTVAPVEGSSISSCDKVKPGVTTSTVLASDLITVGAERVGWAYGVLAMPFKYYAHNKSFGTGVAIGPYFGRRWGTPGSAYTFAAAATIGTVKGEVRDAQNNITSTPDLQAFSLALGWMYDISKAQNTKPFKIGFFVGVDAVGSDNVVKFKNNRKPWLAFQIGFDFTDN